MCVLKGVYFFSPNLTAQKIFSKLSLNLIELDAESLHF
jgi:hypothetical protein